MFSSFRLSTGLMVCGLALACAASAPASAWAQTADQAPQPSVEIYGNAPVAVSPDREGVLPEGMEWNHPLKAGDLVLQPKLKPQPKKKILAPQPPQQLPVGELKPPVIGAAPAKAVPPQISAGTGSTSSVMLLQGMKNALQQAGHNPEIPKSDLQPAEASKESLLGAAQKAQPALQPPVLPGAKKAPPAKEAAAPVKPAGPVTIDGVTYEPGREPKMLGAASGAPAAPKTVSGETPKVTDMAAPPPSLAAVVDGEIAVPTSPPPSVAVPAIEGEEKASSGESLIDSIFGKSVEDKITAAEKEEPKEAQPKEESGSIVDMLFGGKGEAPKTEAAKESDCKPSVEKWTRDCQDAGYPAYFKGEIVGETRVLCPSGEAREVWLSNSCAATFANEPAPASSAKETAKEESKPAPAETTPAPAVAAAAAPVVIDSESAEPADGSCGASNGLAALAKPASDLCLKGKATIVTGDGPWRWNCQGIKGGMTVSCAAPVSTAPAQAKKEEAAKAAAAAASVVEDGQCGSAAEGGTESAPKDNLCRKGAPSAVNGSGPWTWACSGSNGGQAAACMAQRKTDGRCGSAGRSGVDGMPTRDLCAAGFASAVTGKGPWQWTCSGLYGGEAATCKAEPKIDAVCGEASAVGHHEKPAATLCAVGEASAVDGDGPWLWTCKGGNGGATVACRASVATDGACGAAHGSQFTDTPNKGLCASGRASLVTGEGPWNWTCMGADGGHTVSCAASRGTKETLKDTVACGEATETLALSKPGEKLCAAGQPSDVSGKGPWSWSCADAAGHEVACTTLTSTDGACGDAAGKETAAMPSAKLCASGMPGDVTPDRLASKWVWKCDGAMGGASAACSAPLTASSAAPASEAKAPVKDVTAVCGNANGQGFTAAPTDNLCAAGEASAVKGEGPWKWSCAAGGKKGAKVECEALKLTDGACGAANGSIQKTAPMAGLCAAGTATELFGTGPWMWSCVGTGGGNSVSCSALSQAQTKVDGNCGAAANVAVAQEPAANLCDSGTPSTVYGEGPWTWTCSGLNGGIASTCRANKITPKAPNAPGPTVNGLCGPSNGVALEAAPKEGLCSTGTATSVNGNGPWSWGCIGLNGGMTVSCVAPLMPPAPIVGACGASSGVPTLTAPRGSLCAAGISSAVSGSGPWTWSCSGTNGGGAVSCVAPIAGKGEGPLPSLTTPGLSSGNEAPAPAKAPVGLVTPTLPSGEALAPVKPTVIPNRKSSKPVAAAKKIKEEAPAAPPEAPGLPEGVKVLKAPEGTAFKPTPGVVPPVKDSAGNPVPRTHLVLEPDISSISFKADSDQLDRRAVEIVEKLARVLIAHDEARITLVAYASTEIDRSPRDARKMSLNRALAIRDLLTGKGIPTNRVDIRPMGANVTAGDMDRVDVQVN